MTQETFFEKFNEFVDAPTAVSMMRELVLQLAVQGKLVEQRPTELSALECVRNANKPLIDLVPDESIECPAGWLAVPLGSLISSNMGGGTPSRQNPVYWNGSIPWASVKDVRSEKYLASTIDSITEEGLKNSSSNLIPPNRLIVVTRVGLGKLAINTIPVAINQDLRAIEPTSALDLDFAYLLFKSVTLEGTGVTVKGISVAKLQAITVLMPPLAEQKRIVAKVDELMMLCNRLDAQQRERERRYAALARASLVSFAYEPTPTNLGILFHQSYPISAADLRKTILTLALRGKLVNQDANDKPSEELLTDIEAERRHYAQAHKFRCPIAEPLNDSAEPFTIPSNWKWCRLSSICNAVTDGDHLPPPKSDRGVAFLTIGNITTRKLVFEGTRFVPDSYYKGLADFRRPVRGDILYTVVGATYGRPVLVDSDRPFCVQRHIAILKPPQNISAQFLMIVLRSPLIYEQATISITGTAQPTIPLGSLRNFIAPLPPLHEQHRIVAKVAQLIALADQLEAEVTAARAASTKLIEAVVCELTGTARQSDRKRSVQYTTSMKSPANVSTRRRALEKPLKITTQSFVLRRFAMVSGYRSLGKFDCTYHSEKSDPAEASPICLVGLNGSGKSNLIEAIAEVFCFLELINLPWVKVASASSRYRENGHRFEIEYTIEDNHGERLIRVRKKKKSGAEFFVVSKDGSEKSVKPGREQLLLLPRRIIGYSSGLNETVSHPFLRTKTIYSEEVRDAAPPEGVAPSGPDAVFDTRTLYMDYESNAAILICNYIFQKPSWLAIFEKFTRVREVSSFGLRFNRKRAGKSGPHSVVRLTGELHSYLRSFARCSGVEYDESQISYDLQFHLNHSTKTRFRKEFKTAENLFMAMHKWSLLNALILSDEQRKVYLRSDITKGALERPPSVPPSDRVFNIVDLKLNLSMPTIEIDYSGLSDGEHQFVQVFGTALLFSEPGTLFLFDEPESHFNPEWRTKFNLILNDLPHACRQEYIISTHSPFIVSGSRQSNVYKFTRTGADIRCEPVDFETYGASFDVLLKKLFSIDSLIDQSARKELEKIIKRGNENEMKIAVEDFAESKEKRRLYEAIIQKEKGK